MNYRILCVGRIKDHFYRERIEALCGFINKGRDSIEIIEFMDLKIPEHLKDSNKEQFIEKECSPIMEKMGGKDYVIALCIEGKEITTKQHKEYICRASEQGYENIIYVIGGSLGLSAKVKQRANLKMSFSKMTFPHQMMRMVLCEEIANMI